MRAREKGRVPSKKLTIEKAAERLADIAEKHLAKLSDSERSARLEAFHKTTSRICGNRSKPEGQPRTSPIPGLSRDRE